ncbi:MAG: hypothetical protein HYX80_06195 [Chloroflexi bacterium]|nr:hypothetical protein [Chloroflexota bacterium]
MSNNDVVLCRSFGNEPLVRVVWSVTDEGILIYGQDNRDWSKQVQDDSVPVLAPFDAVYEYDDVLFPQLEKTFRNFGGLSPKLERLWQQARPYKVKVANINKVDK